MKEEKETIITWNMQNGRIIAKDFIIPRRYVKLGKPRKGRSFIKKAQATEVLERQNSIKVSKH